jgi:hypothetical protein
MYDQGTRLCEDLKHFSSIFSNPAHNSTIYSSFPSNVHANFGTSGCAFLESRERCLAVKEKPFRTTVNGNRNVRFREYVQIIRFYNLSIACQGPWTREKLRVERKISSGGLKIENSEKFSLQVAKLNVCACGGSV